jgi:hypothetical protein
MVCERRSRYCAALPQQGKIAVCRIEKFYCLSIVGVTRMMARAGKGLYAPRCAPRPA